MVCNIKQIKLCGDNKCNICLPRSIMSYNGKTSEGNYKIKLNIDKINLYTVFTPLEI